MRKTSDYQNTQTMKDRIILARKTLENILLIKKLYPTKTSKLNHFNDILKVLKRSVPTTELDHPTSAIENLTACQV
jgi:hypothetical protein